MIDQELLDSTTQALQAVDDGITYLSNALESLLPLYQALQISGAKEEDLPESFVTFALSVQDKWDTLETLYNSL